MHVRLDDPGSAPDLCFFAAGAFAAPPLFNGLFGRLTLAASSALPTALWPRLITNESEEAKSCSDTNLQYDVQVPSKCAAGCSVARVLSVVSSTATWVDPVATTRIFNFESK